MPSTAAPSGTLSTARWLTDAVEDAARDGAVLDQLADDVADLAADR